MNRLINSSSPYLLQHANNPVDWYPWSEDALLRAQTEDKPILVSIGYSACHWCHVMEHESFEEEETAQIMNEHFINIKIDREERPDLDHIYMEAVQVLTGHGGWPLNVFLTPDKKPFYGGTYFPPVPAYNRSSWKQLLLFIADAFKNRRAEIESQAEKITGYISESNKILIQPEKLFLEQPEKLFSEKDVLLIFEKLKVTFDHTNGGFGNAPKFPGTMTIQFLLRDFYFRKNQESLDHALLSLDKMCMGGIYDHLGGGFARYSTDEKWLAPHFEKMLYDNALLVIALCEANQLLQEQKYSPVIRQTLKFIEREMMSDERGFFTALDADSEGVEGKFYVWDLEEVKNILGEDGKIFCEFYDITLEGNWEEKNIIHQKTSVDEFAKRKKLDTEEFEIYLEECRNKLFDVRSKRIRPRLDDKIILSLNALMCSAFAKAYQTLGDKQYLKIAEANIRFLLSAFRDDSNSSELLHAFKNSKAYGDAILDEYSYLIDALMNVYEITFDEKLLMRAKEYADLVIEQFIDEQDGFFFFNSKKTIDVLLHKKEFYDNATPSGNSMMAKNLQRLSIYFDNDHYRNSVLKMLVQLKNSILQYPSSFSNWINVMLTFIFPGSEVAVVGKDYLKFSNRINAFFLPDKILMATMNGNGNYFPILKGKVEVDHTQFFICKNYACLKPVTTFEEFLKIIQEY